MMGEGSGGADDVMSVGLEVSVCEVRSPTLVVTIPLVFIRAVGAEDVPAGAIIMTWKRVMAWRASSLFDAA